jgi:hypothetical protein
MDVFLNVDAIPDLFVQPGQVLGIIGWFGDEDEHAILNIYDQAVTTIDFEVRTGLSWDGNLVALAYFNGRISGHGNPPWRAGYFTENHNA